MILISEKFIYDRLFIEGNVKNNIKRNLKL